MKKVYNTLKEKNVIKIAAHQPNFIPWAGFWNKLVNSDVFIITAGMQYVRRGFSNRVIMSDNGSWATVPVKAGFIPHNEIKITDLSAVRHIGKRILHWSKQKKYLFSFRLKPIINKLINIDDKSLAELNIDLIKTILKTLNHNKTKIVVDNRNWKEESKLETIVHLLKENGDIFLSGPSLKEYLDKKSLEQLKDRIMFQDLKNNLKNETILHVIASKQDPIEYINSVADWKLEY